MTRKNIYIIGAQSTGKTTLVNALEALYKVANDTDRSEKSLPRPFIIREVARTVLKDKGFTREDIIASPSRALQLQKHILNAQREAEATASKDASSSWYICDRSGLDPIVYTQLFVGAKATEDMLASEAWKELEANMKAGIVVLCEAGCGWLIDDGTRLMPDDLEAWMRVDAAFRRLLEVRGIDYTVIPKGMASLDERVYVVRSATSA